MNLLSNFLLGFILLGTLFVQAQGNEQLCPEGYVLVQANVELGTQKDFCVAQFEMKNQEGSAVSLPLGSPWTEVDQDEARQACRFLGLRYHLIRNEEWMTIAQNIEKNPKNWSGSSVGVGRLNQGHSDWQPGRALQVSDLNNPFCETLNVPEKNWEQKRTHELLSGEVIWDFSGNAWEWVDWNVAYGKAEPIYGWAELQDVSPGWNMPKTSYKPLHEDFTSKQGIGLYYSGPDGSGGAALRGGGFFNRPEAGIYTLFLNSASYSKDPSMGFRCVYELE